MEDPERFEDLSTVETAMLGKRRQGIRVVILTAAVVTPLIFSVVTILSRLWLYMSLFFLVAVALMFLALRSSIEKVSALSKDLRDGKTKIVVNRIESQRQDIRQGGDTDNPRMIYTYLIKVKDREMEVSEDQYYQCKPGQLVEIRLGPNSNYVLAINVLEDSVPESNPESAFA